jgi:hypothetical protein
MTTSSNPSLRHGATGRRLSCSRRMGMRLNAIALCVWQLVMITPLAMAQGAPTKEPCTISPRPVSCLSYWWRYDVTPLKLVGAAVLVFFATFLPRVLVRLVIFVLTKIPFVVQCVALRYYLDVCYIDQNSDPLPAVWPNPLGRRRISGSTAPAHRHTSCRRRSSCSRSRSRKWTAFSTTCTATSGASSSSCGSTRYSTSWKVYVRNPLSHAYGGLTRRLWAICCL